MTKQTAASPQGNGAASSFPTSLIDAAAKAAPSTKQLRTKTAAEVFADMEKLRAEQEVPLIDTVEHLVNVAVRKPKSGEFFRTHPDEEMSLRVSIFEDQDERIVYYVEPSIRPLLGEQLRVALLTTCINQAGLVFLWPIRLPGRVFSARGELPEPAWPERSLKDYLTVAFEGRIVDHSQHDVILRLQGLK